MARMSSGFAVFNLHVNDGGKKADAEYIAQFGQESFDTIIKPRHEAGIMSIFDNYPTPEIAAWVTLCTYFVNVEQTAKSKPNLPGKNMDKQQRLGEIDGMLRHLQANPCDPNAGKIYDGLMAERAKLAPLQAFRRACDSGAVEATARVCRRDMAIEKIQTDIAALGTLNIHEVESLLEALFAGCDGDTSINLQQCLENVKADALAIEALNDELPDPGWRDGPFTTV